MTKSWAREGAISAMILAGIGIVAGLYLGRVVFVPIAAALALHIVLRPVVRRLEASRIPAPVGAALVVLGSVAVACGLGYALTPSIESFIARVPAAATAVSAKLRTLPVPFDRLASVIDLSEEPPTRPSMHATNDSTKQSPVSSPAQSASPMIGRVFGTATSVVSAIVETLLLLMFFLAAGEMWRDRLLKHAPNSAAARRLTELGDEIQTVLSRYLAATAVINLGQGLVFAGVAALLGLPAPPMWGLLTFLAEFIPYLGGFVMVVLLTVVSWAGADGIGHALLAPASYLLITTLQNNIVSPLAYGRQLKLNPAAILVSTLVWWFLWGVPGAFLSVPILAVVKILCDRGGERFAPVAALIAG